MTVEEKAPTKTRDDLRNLLRGWDADPFWNLDGGEPGFEAYGSEITAHVAKRQAEWGERRSQEDTATDESASALGIPGIYQMVLALQRQVHDLEGRLADLDGPTSTPRPY